MKTKTTHLWIVLIVSFFTSCTNLRVSNPGKARYTNYKGFQLSKKKKSKKESAFQLAPENSIANNTAVAAKSSGPEWEVIIPVTLWALLSIALPFLFIIGLKSGWAMAALIGIGLVGGVLWVFNILLIVILIMLAVNPPRFKRRRY